MSKLCDYIDSVIDNRGKNPDKYYSIEKYPVIDNYLIKNTIYPNMSDVNRYINQEEYNNFLRCYIRKDEVLMTLVGNGYGNVTLAPSDNVAIIQNTIGFRTNNNLNSIFLFYYLQYISKSIKALDRGSSQPSLKVSDILDLNVNIPDIKKQILISNALQTIDLKIENNNKIISTLESLAKTIYDYWFLQFEFPNENGKPYKSSGGKMVWNDELKREIPEGWEIKQLGCFANLYQPKTISEKDLNSNGKYFVYGANGIIGKYDKFNHQDREIAICCRGASCGNYVMTIPNSWITGNSMIVSTKNKEFIYYSLSKSTIDNYITGSAQPQITRTNLESAKFLIPSSKILNEFERKATTVRSKIETIFYENQELASLRDFLLPLLMNGQVTFKEES